ncbi:MAG: HEPN domain-containing protein [Candidatus Hydrogenedentota bacterium]
MNKYTLEQLVDIRVSEARALLESGHYEGSYYLAGYAVECAIKACIAKQVREHDFPDKNLAQKSHQHDLTELLGVAGLKQKLVEKGRIDSDFLSYWGVVKDWAVHARYECSIDSHTASDFLEALTDKNSGVLAWLKTFW